MVKRFFLAVILTAFSVISFAQEVKEVTLVVNGDGATKEEATHVALRSAIEQAFGTFVSANTTILNDELVKDEIATVSSGNIQSYTELSSYTLSNGNTSVSLQATVSIGKLVTYAKSKGSECEFAGATFGENIKMLKLKYENSKKTIENLVQYIKEVGPSVLNKNIIVGEPRMFRGKQLVDMQITFDTNENTSSFYNYVMSTLYAIAINGDDQEKLEQLGYRKMETIRIADDRDVSRSRDEFIIPLCEDDYSFREDDYHHSVGFDNSYHQYYLQYALYDYCIEPVISSNIGVISISLKSSQYNLIDGYAYSVYNKWFFTEFVRRMYAYYLNHEGKSIRKNRWGRPIGKIEFPSLKTYLPSLKFVFVTSTEDLSKITGFSVK